VTALVANLPGLNVRNSTELRQSLPTIRSRHSDHPRRSVDIRGLRELDFSSDGVSNGHHKPRNRQKHQGMQLARSTASLDCKQSPMQSQMQRRRSPRVESAMEHLHKSRKNGSQLQSLEFDSEPTYYRLQVYLSLNFFEGFQNFIRLSRIFFLLFSLLSSFLYPSPPLSLSLSLSLSLFLLYFLFCYSTQD
jgi:hypothetical protein